MTTTPGPGGRGRRSSTASAWRRLLAVRISVVDASPPARRWLTVSSLFLYGLAVIALLTGAFVGPAGAWYLSAVLSLWVANVLVLLRRCRASIPALAFHLALAFFVLDRPLLSAVRALPFGSAQEAAGAPKALLLIALSLVGLRLGQAGADRLTARTSRALRQVRHPGPDAPSRRILLRCLAVANVVCAGCALALSIESLLFVRSHSYAEYYVTFHSHLPAALTFVATAAPAVVALFLAFRPRARWAALVLALYVLTAVPNLAMGQRGPFIQALLFAAIVLLIRRAASDRAALRIPVALILVFLVALPVSMAVLGSLGHSRLDETSSAKLDPVMDFLYEQSVTFTVVARGLEEYRTLPAYDAKWYSVGTITDYVTYGRPGQIFLGNEPLGGNSVRHATVGHDFAHAYSYRQFGVNYLEGRGSGSSYLIETFIDLGYAGVLAYSVLLAVLLGCLPALLRGSWPVVGAGLMILQGIFMAPRGNATEFLLFLVLPQVWLAFAATAAAVAVIPKLVSRRRGRPGALGAGAPNRTETH